MHEYEWIWLVGCFGFNGPLRQYFSLYRAVSQREGERGEKRIDESKNVQTTPTRTYYKRSRPLPYCNPNCRTPWHCKFTQHHCTTRPPQIRMECSALNSHLYIKIFVPSPSCSCGDFEIAYHFFFICPNYSNARNLYLPSNLNDLNTHQLLHGKPDVPDSDNERLFLQVQDFIMHSRRFI